MPPFAAMGKRKQKQLKPLSGAEAALAQNLPLGIMEFCQACEGEGRTRRIIEDVVFLRTENPGLAQQLRGEAVHLWIFCTHCQGCGTVERRP